MKIIITIVIIFYTLTAGAIGWAVHDSTPPKIIYEKSTDECQNVLSTKECEDNSVIKESLTTCTNKLKDAWYQYETNCNMECIIPECEECENFGAEKLEFIIEKDSLLKTVKDCREKESKLADEVKDLKNKYNF